MNLANDIIEELHLLRDEDVSGVSGTGLIARGVKLASGKVVIEWCSFHSSLAIFSNIADLIAVHGHEGRTRVVMGPPIVVPAIEKPVSAKRKRAKLKGNAGDGS